MSGGVSGAFERVAVVGAGYMGMGIAQVLALHGAQVRVVDATPEATARAVVEGLRQMERYETAELLPAGSRARVEAAVTGAQDVRDAVHGVELVIEAVPEDPALKHAVLARISDAADPGMVIASNTSSIPIGRLGEAISHPERVVGMHWFNPPMFVPGIEVIPTGATDPAVVDRVVATARGAGKHPVVVADSPGFVGNRLQFALFREAALLIEEGVATAEQIDEVVRTTFGYRLPFFGPFTIADMAGLDVYAGAYATLEETLGERFSAPRSLTALVAEGRTGVKSGRGGYATMTVEQQQELVARRDRWYADLGRVIGD